MPGFMDGAETATPIPREANTSDDAQGTAPSLVITPTRELFKTVIPILIGPAKHVVPVHQEILTSVSPVFAASINPAYGFREACEARCCMPEMRIDDFRYFVQWLYTRTLDHEELEGRHPAYFRMFRLYTLADQLGVSLLKNAILETVARVADRSNACPTPADTVFLYAQTVESARLRVLVLDLFEYKKVDKLIKTHEDHWDENFFRDLIVRLKCKKDGQLLFPWKREAAEFCRRYHEHDNWAPLEGCAVSSFRNTEAEKKKFNTESQKAYAIITEALDTEEGEA